MSQGEQQSAAESESTPRGVRHVIAVAGARGGVGTSVLAVNLSVYLAQLGRTVVLVDADPSGAKLHNLLGLPLPAPPDGDADAPQELAPAPTPIPGLLLLAQAYTPGSTVPVRPGRKPRWARGIRQLDADYVLLDLGTGTAPATLDLLLSADLGLCVTAPEPPSVESTYRFARALFVRRLRRALLHDRFRLRLVERAEAELVPLPRPVELVRAVGRYDVGTGQLAARELAGLTLRLIVNLTRLRNDAELGPAMTDLARRYLGVTLDHVGNVEQDDAVWLSVVRSQPLLTDSPASKSARNLERIARRVLALVSTRGAESSAVPPSLSDDEPSLYEILGTQRSATDEELRRAYKRQRDIYEPGSLALTSLLTEDELEIERSRVEEAHDTLLDPLRRRAYDISTFAEEEQQRPAHDTERSAAEEAERAMLREELGREINAETEFTGRLLRKVRESQGVEIEDIANRTKISSAHLKAIEAEDFSSLPALVYTRGFVQQVAKHLRLDPTQVSRTYLRRMREWQAATEHDGS